MPNWMPSSSGVWLTIVFLRSPLASRGIRPTRGGEASCQPSALPRNSLDVRRQACSVSRSPGPARTDRSDHARGCRGCRPHDGGHRTCVTSGDPARPSSICSDREGRDGRCEGASKCLKGSPIVDEATGDAEPSLEPAKDPAAVELWAPRWAEGQSEGLEAERQSPIGDCQDGSSSPLSRLLTRAGNNPGIFSLTSATSSLAWPSDPEPGRGPGGFAAVRAHARGVRAQGPCGVPVQVRRASGGSDHPHRSVSDSRPDGQGDQGRLR